MKLDPKEKQLVDNLLKLLRRIRMDGFTGEEALAFSISYQWLVSLMKEVPPQAPPPVPPPKSEKVVDIKDKKKR